MWDNESIGQYVIDEQDRLERLQRRFEAEEQMECELPFVTVPNDYGKHGKELYFGGGQDERGN
jgi:hypothetical protein